MGKEKTNDQGWGQSQRRRRMGWGGERTKGKDVMEEGRKDEGTKIR